MNAAKITGASQSNLALAFVALSRERKRDMTVFYAFCRMIDDIADSSELEAAEKKNQLTAWRQWLREPSQNESEVAPEVRQLIAKYSLKPEMLDEIIDGVEMDLGDVRYETFEALRLYCYRVASAVGLVSIEIFGYRNPACRDYAVQLGLALQMTNIIRDVGKDLDFGRIYLPREDLDRFQYPEADLRQKIYDEAFVRLMRFEADRAEQFFDQASRLLPPEDRRAMVAAEIMGSIYHALLYQMKADGFRVFEKDYRLNRLQKAGHIIKRLVGFR